MIRKNIVFYLWALAYILLLCFVVLQYTSFGIASTMDSLTLDTLLLGPQKVLFNGVLVFSVLLYATRREYLSNEYLVRLRGKKSLLGSILLHGVQRVFIYAGLTTAVFFGLACGLLGFVAVASPVFAFLKLLMFGIVMYLYVSILYIKTGNHVLSIFVIAFVHFAMLAVIFVANFYFGGPDLHEMAYWNRPILLVTLTAAGIILLYLSIRRKEYL